MAASVEKRIYDLLVGNKLQDFCDQCIAKSVSRPTGGHINSTQVRNATSAFEVVTKEFKRSLGICSVCQNSKKVIRAL